MSLIDLRGAGVVSPRPLFQNLDLTIHETDRIGLIAGNGAGKTTLLRCLAGQIDLGAGRITRRRGLRVGFVEQDVPADLLGLTMHEAIRRALPAAERDGLAWKIGLVLDMLETPPAMRERTLAELSGGWQRLALLARAWVTDPDVLLLDEPTNHLDSQRLAVLETWIAHATEGVAMVIASHDRQFLDHRTNRTLFLRPEVSRVYAHPFSAARELLAHDDAERETKLARDAKEADRLRRNAGQLRNVGINSGSDLMLKKAKYLTNRAEAIEQSLRPVERVRSGDIRLSNRGTHAKVLIALDDVAVATRLGRGAVPHRDFEDLSARPHRGDGRQRCRQVDVRAVAAPRGRWRHDPGRQRQSERGGGLPRSAHVATSGRRNIARVRDRRVSFGRPAERQFARRRRVRFRCATTRDRAFVSRPESAIGLAGAAADGAEFLPDG